MRQCTVVYSSHQLQRSKLMSKSRSFAGPNAGLQTPLICLICSTTDATDPSKWIKDTETMWSALLCLTQELQEEAKWQHQKPRINDELTINHELSQAKIKEKSQLQTFLNFENLERILLIPDSSSEHDQCDDDSKIILYMVHF